MSDKNRLPVVARLYYTGTGHKRYRRASTRAGPGEPLCFVSIAEEWLRREKAKNHIMAESVVRLLSDPGNQDYRDAMRAALAQWMTENCGDRTGGPKI